VTCSFEGCDRPNRSYGLCESHRIQQKRHGRLWPVGEKPERTVEEWLQFATPDGDCMLFKPHLKAKYPNVYVKSLGTCVGVHKVVWALHTGGPITGVHIHHTCGQSKCINPAHLERASAAENTLEMLARADYEAEIARLQLRIVELEAELEGVTSGSR
jgi:hypothetical protein